jgi:pSer/pThr/pTyr-binding forkhead associated (FHA) protein/S1-C subfamily serine protease
MARIVLKDLETEQPFSVQDTEGIIGRDPACSFVIEGPKSKVVSGRHARIFYQDAAWWIEDSSRNGTILDDERLQAGQRHAIKVGQIVGLGESGPRLRVAVLESRKVAETLMEMPGEVPGGGASTAVVSTTAPRSKRSLEPAEPNYPDNTSALPALDSHKSPIRFEEATEPMSPAPDWLVKIGLRLASTNQPFEATARVVRIGRSPENNVQIPPELGASVSRRHSEVAIEGGGVVVRDAGSRNGTYLNGRRIDEATPVAKGDQIMLGSGGPTLAVEDLHIVRGTGEESAGGSGGSERTPAQPAKRRDGYVEPRTDPSPIEDKGPKRASPTPVLEHRSFGGVGKTAFFKDVLEDMSQKSARRVRVVVWASVMTTVLIAVALLAVTQWRVAASEERIATEQRRYEARADSIRVAASAEASRLRAAFDSARASSAPRAVLDSLRNALADASRRTGVLEVALLRARESLNQQLAAGDSARRAAEEETNRLRAELGRATDMSTPIQSVDSLRRALKVAEERANDVATQVRTVRGANLAQVAQLNQGAVGLLVSFVGDRVVAGSGFAITPSGYFVTNRHVVTDDSGRVRDSIYVTMADQRFTLAHRVQVVALGPRDVDIAVVKIPEYRGPYMKRLDWAAAGASQGEPAALIGFPYGVELAFDDTTSNVVRTSMSAGIFSKVSADRIQFDGFTVGGSSGSPIFNAVGEVVAVHRAGYSTGRSLSFSIPVSRVLAILPPDARNELGIR